MLRRMRRWMVAVLAAFAACTEHDPEIDRVGAGPIPDPGSTCNLELDSAAELPCEIEKILVARCQRCHQAPQKNGAPFPLLTWNDLLRDYGGPLYETAYKAVKSDFMPYCAAGGPFCGNLEGGPVEPLSAEQKATLLAYLKCPEPAHGQSCSP